MRRDATRNHETILTAAIDVLAASPQASMRDIADASGAGRTTLYRHFPDREALVAAIYDRVFSEADLMTARVLADAGDDDPVETVARLGTRLASFGDRYRFLARDLSGPPAAGSTPLSDGGARLLEYLAVAQRDGNVRDDLDARWLFDAVVGIISRAAAFSFADGEERTRAVARTLRAVLAPTDGEAR